ncbi:hypothetical protein, partial [Actinocatenispora comari]|uniref:hypothetical protein n=1 Tax=Actinocatenispora comari TaxID=2807577 RepID=UPI001A91AF7F
MRGPERPPNAGRPGAAALPGPGESLLPRRSEVVLALLLAPTSWLATFDPQPAIWRRLLAAGLSGRQLRALIAARRSLPGSVAADSVGRSALGSVLFRAAQLAVVAAWFLVQLTRAGVLGPYSAGAVLRLVALAALVLVAVAVGARWALYSPRRELVGLVWGAVAELCRTAAPDRRIRATRRPTAAAMLRRAERVAATRLAPRRTADARSV